MLMRRIDFRVTSVCGEPTSWQIAAIFAVIVVQAGLIFSSSVRERSSSRYAEVQSRERMSELAHTRQSLFNGRGVDPPRLPTKSTSRSVRFTPKTPKRQWD